MLNAMRQRQPLSKTELLLFAAPALAILLSCGLMAWHRHSTRMTEVDVVIDTAPYSTLAVTERAALDRLALEAQHSPQLFLYRINMTGTGFVKIGWLVYLPSAKLLSLREETSSTTHDVPTWDWHGVDDNIIAKVAQEAAGLQNLARYGCHKSKEKPPTEQEMRDSGTQMLKDN